MLSFLFDSQVVFDERFFITPLLNTISLAHKLYFFTLFFREYGDAPSAYFDEFRVYWCYGVFLWCLKRVRNCADDQRLEIFDMRRQS